MADIFTDLLAQYLGDATFVQPLFPSFFAPVPSLIADTTPLFADDQEIALPETSSPASATHLPLEEETAAAQTDVDESRAPWGLRSSRNSPSTKMLANAPASFSFQHLLHIPSPVQSQTESGQAVGSLQNAPTSELLPIPQPWYAPEPDQENADDIALGSSSLASPAGILSKEGSRPQKKIQSGSFQADTGEIQNSQSQLLAEEGSRSALPQKKIQPAPFQTDKREIEIQDGQAQLLAVEGIKLALPQEEISPALQKDKGETRNSRAPLLRPLLLERENNPAPILENLEEPAARPLFQAPARRLSRRKQQPTQNAGSISMGHRTVDEPEQADDLSEQVTSLRPLLLPTSSLRTSVSANLLSPQVITPSGTAEVESATSPAVTPQEKPHGAIRLTSPSPQEVRPEKQEEHTFNSKQKIASERDVQSKARPFSRSEAATREEEHEGQPIRVHIGRVVVRGVAGLSHSSTPPTKRTLRPTLSLNEYLQQREKGKQ